MFRALSTRGRGYEKLTDEYKEEEASDAVASRNEAKLNRARSLPAKIWSLSSKKPAKSDQKVLPQAKSEAKQSKKASKIHPIFSFFDGRLRKKMTAKPEFSRYLQYIKEGGIWDANSNKPAIYYK